MTKLALHHLSLLDVDPLTFVDIAAEAGCSGVCVFAYISQTGVSGFQLPSVTKAMLPDMKRRVADKGLTVDKADFFVISDNPPFDEYRGGFEIAANLGAKFAITLVYDTVTKRATENLAKLATIAAEYGLTLAIEFMSIAPGCKTIEDANAMIRAAGRDNIGISIDALHLERSGGKPSSLAAIDPKLLVSAQICDGPLGISDTYIPESLDRMVPGEGQFPLVDLVKALPSFTAYDIETPVPKLQAAGVSPLDRARRLVAGARRIMEQAKAG
jgi:sugar phosphate isomerase/epimerase